ncbi:nucleoside recognition protein [Desulfosoma sp.]
MSELSWVTLITKTASFSASVLLIMGIGLAASEILLETGLLRRLEGIGKPLSRLAHLPDVCGVAVVAGILSPLAANTMLQSLREEKIITDRETFFASLLNGTIAPVKEAFTYQLPVILPALGIHVGLVYIGTLWLGAFVLFVFVAVCGRLALSSRVVANRPVAFSTAAPPSVRKAVHRWVKRFGRIAGIFFCVTFCVFLLMDLGILAKLEGMLSPLAAQLNLPPIVFPSVAAYVASPLVGISMMGSLVRSASVGHRDAIVALLFGSLFMLPVLYLRFYVPQWVAIFGVRLGVLRALTSASLIMATRLFVLFLFLW